MEKIVWGKYYGESNMGTGALQDKRSVEKVVWEKKYGKIVRGKYYGESSMGESSMGKVVLV